MVIGVLSDTHIPKKAKQLPTAVLKVFSRADHIIHAGDIISENVIAMLEEFAPVTAVAGNLDPSGLREKLGEKKIIRLGNLAFGIFHGHGEKGKTIQRVMDRFRDDRVDCIVFGHSHTPVCRYEGDVLLFNPGSPTDRRRNRYCSIGLIETEGAELRPRILYLNTEGEIV